MEPEEAPTGEQEDRDDTSEEAGDTQVSGLALLEDFRAANEATADVFLPRRADRWAPLREAPSTRRNGAGRPRR